ncbi:MAG: hypothetical protein U0930_07305 [Pirellulales bacterium]
MTCSSLLPALSSGKVLYAGRGTVDRPDAGGAVGTRSAVCNISLTLYEFLDFGVLRESNCDCDRSTGRYSATVFLLNDQDVHRSTG